MMSYKKQAALFQRRSIVTALGVALVASMLPSSAVAQSDLPLIGFVSPQSREAQSVQIEAFLDGMERLGWVEGQNVRYEWRFSEGDPERTAPLVAEIVALEPDVIVTPPGIRLTVAEATSTIPIVVANMSSNQLVDIRALANTNITGTARLADDPADPERFQLAAELVGAGARVGYLLYTGGADGGEANREAAQSAAEAAGVVLVLGETASVEGIAAGAEEIVAQGVDAIIYTSGGGVFSVGRPQMIEVATRTGVPTIYGNLASVRAGGLMSLGANVELTFFEAAGLVDQILNGASPADLPIAEYETAWLAVNLDAAEEIGFTVPQLILDRANEIVE
jgi:putative ABC transport system substrate-binding protein